MINIPTELLRTLLAVVDLRSFTKAAQSLGVTQPAVSAQIKRLQGLVGADLLDKSAPGVTLTSFGEVVVGHARRILSINDQILDLSSPNLVTQPIRIGMTGDFAAAALSRALACFRASHPETRFIFKRGNVDALQRALREADVDLVIAVSERGAVTDAFRHWSEGLIWVQGPSFELPSVTVPLVCYGDECVFNRTAVEALSQAGLSGDVVFCGSSIAGLCEAVSAGLGVMVLPRSSAVWPDLVVCEDPRLPKLPEMSCGVYVREGSGRDLRERLAQVIAETLCSQDVSRINPAAPAASGPVLWPSIHAAR
jgi:DNA-binding transcriptional LysR family regulator